MKIRCLSFLVFVTACHCLLASSFIVGWGQNISGQCTGTPSVSQYFTGLVVIAKIDLTDTVAIAAGLSHGLALKADGTVIGWGNNMSGRAIGVDTEFPHRASGAVVIAGSTLKNVVAISASQQSLALNRDGSVVSWGRDASGRNLTPPFDLGDVAVISAGGNHNMALRHSGTVVKWRSEATNTLTGLSNVISIAACASLNGYDLALVSDGTVVRIGSSQSASLEPVGLSNMIAIAAGGFHYLALSQDGVVTEWGSNNTWFGNSPSNTYGPNRLVTINGSTLSNVVAIAAGFSHSLALKQDGTLAAWGRIGSHPATVPAGLSNVVAIAAGNDFCLALITNAAVAERFRR